MAMNNIGIGITINVNAGQSSQQANQAASALNNVTKSAVQAAGAASTARKEFANLAGAYNQLVVGKQLVGMFGAIAMKSDEVTMGMQRIKAVMGDGTFGQGGAKRVQDTIMNVAETTGNSFKDVATATKDLMAQGLSSNQVLIMLEPLMKFTRAGEVSTDQATKLVVALTNMGITAQNTGSAFDVILNMANKSSLQVEDFATIVTKSGSVASLTGVGFNDLTAAVTLTRKAFTSAAEQGTALNGTMMFLSRPKTVGKLKNAFGVDVMDEATGKLKPMLALFKEVSNAITSGKGSIGDLFTIFGGKTGAKVFASGIGAFQNGMQFNEKQMKGDDLFNTVMGETEKSGGAVDSAFSKQMQALSPQLDRLKAAFDDLVGTLGQGFTQSLATAIGGIADLITGFRQLLQENSFLKDALMFTFAVISKFAALGGIALVAVASFKIMSLALSTLTTAMPAALFSFRAMAMGIRGVGVASVTTGVAAKSMWRALLGPVGLLLAAFEFLPSIISFFKGDSKDDKANGVTKGLSDAAGANATAAGKMGDAAKSLESVTKEFNEIVAQYMGAAVKKFPTLDPRNVDVTRGVLDKAGKQFGIGEEGLFPLRDAVASAFSEAKGTGHIGPETFKGATVALQQMIGFAAASGDKKAQKRLEDLLENFGLMASKQQILFTQRLEAMKRGEDFTVPGQKKSVVSQSAEYLARREMVIASMGALGRMPRIMVEAQADAIMAQRGLGPNAVAAKMAIQSAEIKTLMINSPLELRIGNEAAIPAVLRNITNHDEVLEGDSQ